MHQETSQVRGPANERRQRAIPHASCLPDADNMTLGGQCIRVEGSHLVHAPTINLETMPHGDLAMARIYAWYEQEIIDRPPLRFSGHNIEYARADNLDSTRWPTRKDRWFDAEYVVESFVESLPERTFPAETFPIFWPNLGPEVYSAFYGCELVYQEVTSYATPIIEDWADIDRLILDMANPYFRKLEEITQLALEQCRGRFLVGYTDLHPGVDCAAAWRNPERLCTDMVMEPDFARRLIEVASRDFLQVYEHFDAVLKAHNQPSVNWMGIPSFGTMHVPSCDFASLISPRMFNEFILPTLADEMEPMTHNVLHMDGKGVAKNLDRFLELPQIEAIQWVQGVGNDRPIMQWAPLIKKIQAAGKSVVVDITCDELEPFIQEMRPEGLFLCICAAPGTETDIIRRVEKW